MNDSSSSDSFFTPESDSIEGFEASSSSSEMVDISSSLVDDSTTSESVPAVPAADLNTPINDWPLECQLLLCVLVGLVFLIFTTLFKRG